MSGTAHDSRDRHRIKTLYKPEWKAWFPDEGARQTSAKFVKSAERS